MLRHGITDWNLEGRLQGRQDIPLSKNYTVTSDNVNLLSKISFDGFYISPLLRAKQTFDLLPITSKKIVFSNELCEMSFGKFEGWKLTDLPKDILINRNDNKWCYRWEGGESYEDVDKRINMFLKNIEIGVVGILAHQNVNKVIVKNVCNLSIDTCLTIKQDNNQIYLLENEVCKVI